MNPFYTISEENPNEIHGIAACVFAGQQKGYDCSGRWVLLHGVHVANHAAPRAAACEYHLNEVVADLANAATETARLGYAAPPVAPDLHDNAGVNPVDTPDVVPAPKPRPRNTRRRAKPFDDVPSL